MSAMTALITRAPPTSAREEGTSWNASHTQKGINGVSSVPIRVACPDGNRRDPSMNSDSPNATWKNPNIARIIRSAPVTLVMPWAKGMLTTLPSRFDNAAAATIGVSLWRRTVTVMTAIATVMRQASAMPRISELARAWPTTMATPHRATTLASMVCHRAASRKRIQANAAATKGPVAMMIATFDTLVSCSAGMKHTMPNVDSDATSQPFLPIPIKSRKPARPCMTTRMAAMRPPPNSPRQNRMVQESKGKSRVKNGAVLQAIAAATTSAMPARCCE